MRLLRSHWGFFVLAGIVAPLLAAFASGVDIASVADDSVSYLVMARHFDGTARPLIEPWVPLHAHFGPLLPLLLAITGGAHDLSTAHALVAAFAVLGLPLVYLLGNAEGRGPRAGLLLVAAFFVMPTAWISVKGILSETLFLCLSLAAVLAFGDATALRTRTARALAFGALVALAYLARSAGVALFAAGAAWVAWSVVRERAWPSWRLLLPCAVVLAAALAWMAVRPVGAAADGYGETGRQMLTAWRESPRFMLGMAASEWRDGWLLSFANDAAAPAATRWALAIVAAFAFAGAILRALANRLDGWYVLATVGMLTLWVFDGENIRRLLYPVMPLVLLHAGIALAAACRLARRPAAAPACVVAGVALVAVLALPASLLIASKSRDATPLVPGLPLTAADMTENYLDVNLARARALAAKHGGVVGGLELVRGATPPDAKVLWARPEYVALISAREGLPLLYAWDAKRLAQEALRMGATHLLATGLSKTDHAHQAGDGYATRRLAAPYTDAVLVVANAITGREELVLLRIDRARLEAFLGG